MCWCGCGVTRMVTMKASTQSRHQRGRAAMSSSTTTALSRQPLAQVLRNLTDPRDRRGVRHDLPTVLSLAVTGVLASCRSLTAIWEHTTDLTAADLEALGLQVGQALPSESTIRRVLQDLDPTDLDTNVRSWFRTRTGTIEGRTVIAVDGKTMRKARTGKEPARRLLAALDQATGTVLAQARVADKSNEIPALRELLKPLDLDGVVVSADAMHTQTDAAEWTRPAGRSLRAHASGRSEDPAQDTQEQDTQEAALTRTSRPPPGTTSLTGGECGARPRRPGLPPGWTSPERLRWSRSGAPEPPRIAGARATTAAVAPRGRLWRWSTWSVPYPWDRLNPSRLPPGSGDIGR